MALVHPLPGARISPTQWHYELVPLLPQPHMDLSASLRSHFVSNPILRRLLRVVGASVFTFLGYLVFLVITMVVFIIPASVGRPLAATGALCGLQAALISISNLRYEMVVVLLKTHDCWFFITVCSLFVVVLSMIFNDVRGFILVVSFLSFVTNVFVDASIVGQHRFWVANVVSVVCHAIMGSTVSIGITDQIRQFDVFELNGYSLPAVAVVRDALGSMTMVLLRNLVREFSHRTKRSKVTDDGGVRVVTCVSYRCRLRVQPLTAGGPIFEAFQSNRTRSTVNATASSSFSAIPTATQLQYVPFIDQIDARNTVMPTRWLWDRLPSNSNDHQLHVLRWCLHCTGLFGFAASTTSILVSLLAPTFALGREFFTLTAVGVLASTIFVGTSLALAHRQVLNAIVTSFDFLFIAIQITIVYACFVDLRHWHPVLVMAVFSSWMWCLWMLSWDSLLPPSRTLLGLRTRSAVLVASALGALLICSTFFMFVVLPRGSIRDRAVMRISFHGHHLEFKPLSWYVSCSATISAWSVRVLWRLWHASEGELVVLDGRVVYEYRSAKHRKHHRIHVAPPVHETLPRGSAVAPHTME